MNCKMMMMLVASVLLVVLCSVPVLSYRPRSLAVNSAFIKHGSNSIKTSLNCNNYIRQSIEEENEAISSSCAIKIRGGAYDDYNDGYNYEDSSRRAPNDDYRYNEGYEQGKSHGSQGSRYEDDYYPRRRNDGYYDDEGRYYEEFDDQGGGRSRRKPPPSKSKLPTVLTSGNRKIGIIFVSSGAAFTALGITLFFNKALMRLGNLLFVCGIPLMIGPGRTLGYFLQPKKARATGCLICGVFLVLVGHPVIGILLEVFGLLNLFGNMFPVLMIMAKNLPVVGNLFGGGDSGSSRRRKERRSREDDYYNDGYGSDDRGYGREQEQWQDDKY